jgi:hypothetical protein
VRSVRRGFLRIRAYGTWSSLSASCAVKGIVVFRVGDPEIISVDLAELATDEDVAVGGGEVAASEDGAIGLDGEGLHGAVEAGAGVESFVECAVGVKSGDAVAGNGIDLTEGSPDQDLSVGLQGDHCHGAIGMGRREETFIYGSAGQQSDDVRAGLSVDGSESATDDQPGIELPGDGVYGAIDSASDVKGRIELTWGGGEGESHGKLEKAKSCFHLDGR